MKQKTAKRFLTRNAWKMASLKIRGCKNKKLTDRWKQAVSDFLKE
jgi:hypothetical protein